MSAATRPPRSAAVGTVTRLPRAHPMTLAVMRAAVTAIRTGAFDDVEEPDAAVYTLLPTKGRPGGAQTPWADITGPVLLVLAGHAGAGASTVAVALAEALVEIWPVHLLEYSEPRRSGLVAATGSELGMYRTHWRRGRRGRLDVFRLAHRPVDGELPSPPETAHPQRVVVVDVGWSVTSEMVGDAPFASVTDDPAIVVTRLTVPAVRQTEHTLAALGGEAVVVALGPTRWPREVEASVGPLLSGLRSQGRVVRMPVDRRLETTGLTADRLPKAVAAAGRSLAALLAPGGPQQSARPRWRPASPPNSAQQR